MTNLINNCENKPTQYQSIEFISSDAMSFKITILGYEFSEFNGDSFDKNWYISEIVLKGKNLSAKLLGPMLLATEIKFLLKEFKKLEKSESTGFVLQPIEPYFELNVSADESDLLKIHGFILPEDKDPFENKVSFLFQMNKNQISKVIEQLNQVLELFPIRE